MAQQLESNGAVDTLHCRPGQRTVLGQQSNSSRCHVSDFLPLAPQASFVSGSRETNIEKHRSHFPSAMHDEQQCQAFHASSLARYPVKPTASNFTSVCVQLPARINNHPVKTVTVDSGSDVPCISVKIIRRHPTLDITKIQSIPPGTISLNSADSSPLKALRLTLPNLTLGDKTLPVEALVLFHLGPDCMLLENLIMSAFGAIMDWSAEQL